MNGQNGPQNVLIVWSTHWYKYYNLSHFYHWQSFDSSTIRTGSGLNMYFGNSFPCKLILNVHVTDTKRFFFSIHHFRLLSSVLFPLLTLVVIGTIFDYLIKFFQGKRLARKPWGQGDWGSRLSREPNDASVFNERFTCFLLWFKKLCGDQVL